MNNFKSFGQLDIEWDISPEDVVTMYLEWGNNNWHAPFAPVRSKEDYVNYFIVDTWCAPPQIRLLRRNSENLAELAAMDLPERFRVEFTAEYGDLRGVFEPTPSIKEWLKSELA